MDVKHSVAPFSDMFCIYSFTTDLWVLRNIISNTKLCFSDFVGMLCFSDFVGMLCFSAFVGMLCFSDFVGMLCFSDFVGMLCFSDFVGMLKDHLCYVC